LDPSKKVTMIEAHNEHAGDYLLWIATGFADDDILMGEIHREENTPDYSKLMINEFIMTKYKMGNPLESIV
jgi:hypothetical protein